jgi:hypothetical protein
MLHRASNLDGGGDEKCIQNLSVNLKGRVHSGDGRTRLSLEDNIKIYLRKIDREVVDLDSSASGEEEWRLF